MPAKQCHWGQILPDKFSGFYEGMAVWVDAGRASGLVQTI